MDGRFALFLSISALLIVVPGPDMALVTKNALVDGRRPALGTALGVSTGLAVWTIASAFGVASLVRGSATAFTALKLAGGAYLVWLGVQALRAVRVRSAAAPAAGSAATGPAAAGSGPRRAIGAGTGFRQGLLSNIANPKIAAFFTSLLPQFVGPHHALLLPFLALGGVCVLMTVVWLAAYAVVAARAAAVLQRPRVKAALDATTGAVLIGLGLRLATERR